MSSQYLPVIFLIVTLHSTDSTLLPSNLMLESFDSKIPVYNSLSRPSIVMNSKIWQNTEKTQTLKNENIKKIIDGPLNYFSWP